MLVAKFFSSSNNEDQETPWSQNPWRKNAIASRENMMNWGRMSPITIYIITLHQVASHVMALKIILYMSRVVRKETLHKYSWICVKSDLDILIS